MIDPESDSEDDNIKFVDDYDKTGVKINDKVVPKTMTEFNKTKTYTSGFGSNGIQNRATMDGFGEQENVY